MPDPTLLILSLSKDARTDWQLYTAPRPMLPKCPMRRLIEKRKTTIKTPPAEASGIVMR
jgi:hypothetical protein